MLTALQNQYTELWLQLLLYLRLYVLNAAVQRVNSGENIFEVFLPDLHSQGLDARVGCAVAGGSDIGAT